MGRMIMTLLAGALLSACCRTTPQAEGKESDPGNDERAAPAAGVVASEAVPPPADPKERVTCPVCGLEFAAGEARAAVTHDGRVYRFLLPDHADAFRSDPKRYLPADAGRP